MIPAAALLALALAQGRFTYKDPKGDLSVVASSAKGVKLGANGLVFDVAGSVVLVSAKQGIRLQAAAVRGETVQNASKQTELRRAVATGGVRLVKTGTGQNTDIQGWRADMNGDVVQVSGPVTIRNVEPTKRETMVATGSSCTATLEPGSKGSKGGIRSAILKGPVRVNIVQEARPGEGATHVIATGSQMRVDNAGTGRIVVLTGNAKVSFQGAQKLGDMSAGTITLLLNTKGEVIEAQTGGRS